MVRRLALSVRHPDGSFVDGSEASTKPAGGVPQRHPTASPTGGFNHYVSPVGAGLTDSTSR